MQYGADCSRLPGSHGERKDPPISFTQAGDSGRFTRIAQKERSSMSFPAQRLRRLRQNTGFRRLVRETSISTDDLILPLFVVPGHGIKKEMSSLPENYHLSIDCFVEEAKEISDLGVSAILLFGV